MKPILDLDDPDLPFDDVEENGFDTPRRASIGSRIGADIEVCEGPDSGKVRVGAGSRETGLRGMFRKSAAVDDDDGEHNADRT